MTDNDIDMSTAKFWCLFLRSEFTKQLDKMIEGIIKTGENSAEMREALDEGAEDAAKGAAKGGAKAAVKNGVKGTLKYFGDAFSGKGAGKLAKRTAKGAVHVGTGVAVGGALVGGGAKLAGTGLGSGLEDTGSGAQKFMQSVGLLNSDGSTTVGGWAAGALLVGLAGIYLVDKAVGLFKKTDDKQVILVTQPMQQAQLPEMDKKYQVVKKNNALAFCDFEADGEKYRASFNPIDCAWNLTDSDGQVLEDDEFFETDFFLKTTGKCHKLCSKYLDDDVFNAFIEASDKVKVKIPASFRGMSHLLVKKHDEILEGLADGAHI